MDQDYVLVSGPAEDIPSSSSNSSKPYNFPFKSQSPPVELFNRSISSTAPMPIIGATGNSIGRFGSLDSQNSAPSTSHGSLDLGDAFEQPSTHSLTRIRSLRKCAATITELVHERVTKLYTVYKIVRYYYLAITGHHEFLSKFFS